MEGFGEILAALGRRVLFMNDDMMMNRWRAFLSYVVEGEMKKGREILLSCCLSANYS